MKKLNLFLLAMITMVSLSIMMHSCDDFDGYSTGNFQIRMATVRVISGNAYYLEIDNGKTLFPAATQIPGYKPVDGKRVVADFTLLYDDYEGYNYGVRVNWLTNVLTKQVEDLTAENEEEFGNDPVRIYDMWIGGNYLNVEFGLFLPVSKAHRVSLVMNTLVEQPEDDYIHLEYRYNDQDDVSPYERLSLVSFHLGDYGLESASAYKGIKVKINSEKNGEKDIVFDFPAADAAVNAKTINNPEKLEESKVK